MIRFDIITIFPEIFNSYLKESLLYRAQKKKLVKINIHNLRKWATDRHQAVDDRPFGGGLGMVLKVEPIYKAVGDIKKKSKTELPLPSSHLWERGGRRGRSPLYPIEAKRRDKSLLYPSLRLGQVKKRTKSSSPIKSQKSKVILFTPRGKKFSQKMAYQFSKLDQMIMICGRYEGVDERVAKHIADLELSIGDYDLMGGELPAQVLIETITRLIPGVLGKPQLLKERITKGKGFIEYEQYTRPEIFEPKKGIKWRIPKVLLSGHHKKIEEWRTKHQKIIENPSDSEG